MVSYQEDHIWQINITPLTDVFLVLLIIFMVAAPFLVQDAIKVHLPSSAMGKPEPKAIVVALDRGNKVYVDGERDKIYQADYLFRAVFLEKGNHIIRFTYDPLSFKIGLLISLGTALVLLVLMVKGQGVKESRSVRREQ